MKITVVTPVLNGAEFLEDCLRSIQHQSHEDWEHIIVDGGSTDGSLEVLKRYQDPRRTVFSGKDRGMYDALNRGFVNASGEIFAYLNADDFYFPGAFYTANKIFNAFPEVKWITGYPASVRDQAIRRIRTDFCLPRPVIESGMFDGKPLRFLNQESMLWRSSLHRAKAPFPKDLKLAGDFWLWTKFSEDAQLVRVNSLIAAWRERKNQLSVALRANYLKEIHEVQAKNELYSKIPAKIRKHCRWIYFCHRQKIPVPRFINPIPHSWRQMEEIESDPKGTLSKSWIESPPDSQFCFDLITRIKMTNQVKGLGSSIKY